MAYGYGSFSVISEMPDRLDNGGSGEVLEDTLDSTSLGGNTLLSRTIRTGPSPPRHRLARRLISLLYKDRLTVIRLDISKTYVPLARFLVPGEGMGNDCQRCREIVAWLHGHEDGLTLRCSFCRRSYIKSKQGILDEAGNVVHEAWWRLQT